MGTILRGKNCVIWKNVEESDRYKPVGENAKSNDKIRRETYEVLKLEENNRSYFPLDTPLYKINGWKKLREAKIFFLLQEI